VLTVGYFLFVIGSQQLEMMHIRQETRGVDTAFEKAVRENEKLNSEKNDLNTLTHIEKMAREELGMVKPGEIPYILTKKQE